MRCVPMFQAPAAKAPTRIAIFVLAALFFLTANAGAGPKLPPLRVIVGHKAPGFSLPSSNGKMVSLSSLRGHNVLIDFYEGYW